MPASRPGAAARRSAGAQQPGQYLQAPGGCFNQAENHWSRAAALAPGYAEPLSNLAHLARERGELDRALHLGQRAIALNPRLADAYVNLAGLEEARSRYAESLRWLDILLGFAPLHAGGLAARALALKNLHRYPEGTGFSRTCRGGESV